MEQEKIDRINHLAHKAKTIGLTPEEIQERRCLREEYLTSIRASLVSQLDNTYIQNPDGTVRRLEKKK